MISPPLSPWWPPVPLDGQDPVALGALRARQQPPLESAGLEVDPATEAEAQDSDETPEPAANGGASVV